MSLSIEKQKICKKNYKTQLVDKNVINSYLIFPEFFSHTERMCSTLKYTEQNTGCCNTHVVHKHT